MARVLLSRRPRHLLRPSAPTYLSMHWPDHIGGGGRRSEWINSFEKVALESSFQRNWIRILMEGADEMVGCGLIDRSVARICWRQGPKGGGWVGLTLFGQGPGGSVSKYKLTDLSNESPPRLTAPIRNGWVKLDQNTFKAIQSYFDSWYFTNCGNEEWLHARFIAFFFFLNWHWNSPKYFTYNQLGKKVPL